MKVVSVINYKGGVGKTTLTSNLGAELASRGQKVLLIDLDPQTSLTFSFYREKQWEQDLAPQLTIKRWFDEFMSGQGDTVLSDLVVSPKTVNSIIAANASSGRLDLIASHLGLINVDLQLASQLVGMGPAQVRERYLEVHSRLANGLSSSSLAEYDLVMIDCPPNFNIVTKTAIIASDHILIPSRPDHLSTLGTSYLLSNVKDLLEDYNTYVRIKPTRPNTRVSEPTVLGAAFMMVPFYEKKPRDGAEQFIKKTRDEIKIPVFETHVRWSPALFGRASTSGVPVTLTKNVPTNISYELNKLADEFSIKLKSGGVSL